MEPEEIRQALEALGVRRRAALEQLAGDEPQLKDLIRRAVAAGIPKAEIHRLGAVSRPTIDAALDD